MEVRIYPPHLALQPFILNISTIRVVLPTNMPEVITPYPPTPFTSLIFYSNHPVSMAKVHEDSYKKQPLAVVVGPQFSRVNIKVRGELNAVRIDFLPGAMFRLFRLPMNELFDEGCDAEFLFGKKIRTLNEQLSECINLLQAKNLVENFLLLQLNEFRSAQPIDDALKFLLQFEGKITMEKIASLSCLSLRQFERNAYERLGMNPKMYARILKFSKAYRLRESCPELSWTKICYDAGYYDQMHMIKDFKIFAGVNPSVIGEQILQTPIKMQRDLPM